MPEKLQDNLITALKINENKRFDTNNETVRLWARIKKSGVQFQGLTAKELEYRPLENLEQKKINALQEKF